MNNEKYIAFLKSHLLTDIADGEIFWYDESCAIKKFLNEEDIAVLQDWPAQSHDLNIIESMWRELEAQLYNRKAKELSNCLLF